MVMSWWSVRAACFVVGITWWFITVRGRWLLARLRILNVELSELLFNCSRWCAVFDDLLIIHSFSEPGTCANLHWLIVICEANL